LPDALYLKTDEADTPEKRGKYTVSVVGCGQLGVLSAMAFAEAGFKVICTDADQSVVKRLSKGNVRLADHELELKLKGFFRAGQLTASSDLKSTVKQSDIIIIIVNPKIDAKKNSDYSELESVCKQIGESLHKGALVVYAGIAGFGLTDGIVKETLENTSGLKVGEDFGLAYSPVRNSTEHGLGFMGDYVLRVAASDKVSLNAAAAVYETIAKKGVKKSPDAKAAELAALFQAAKRDAQVALTNEFAVFCESAGVDYAEMIKLLDNDLGEFNSTPTIAEEENRSEAYLML
jgi:nucleotide sugar dehydrogenase